MFGQGQVGQKVGVLLCKSSMKTIGKRFIKLGVKAPSAPISMSVYILESTVKRTTGSENLARRAALIGHIVVCAPLGPLAVVGGVARWKLDQVIDRL